MKDRMFRNASTVQFWVVVGITALVVAASVILGNAASKPRSKILVPTFLDNLRTYYLCNTISQCLGVLTVLMLVTCLLTLFIGNKTVAYSLTVACFIIFGILFTSALPLFKKPEVVKAKLVDYSYNYSQYGESKYTLLFDNGIKFKIPKKDYEYSMKGKDYYIVMCGDKGIDCFATDEYSLPVS